MKRSNSHGDDGPQGRGAAAHAGDADERQPDSNGLIIQPANDSAEPSTVRFEPRKRKTSATCVKTEPAEARRASPGHPRRARRESTLESMVFPSPLTGDGAEVVEEPAEEGADTVVEGGDPHGGVSDVDAARMVLTLLSIEDEEEMSRFARQHLGADSDLKVADLIRIREVIIALAGTLQAGDGRTRKRIRLTWDLLCGELSEGL